MLARLREQVQVAAKVAEAGNNFIRGYIFFCLPRGNLLHMNAPQLIKLLLPILFPSWRFFSSIGPSPRIDVGFIAEAGGAPESWIPFRPIPSKIMFTQQIIRLFHNPQWNELLYMNSCAERLFEGGDVFYREEIAQRLLKSIELGEIVSPANARFMQFRIRAIYSEDTDANKMGQVKDELFLQSQAYVLVNAGVKP